MVVNNLEPKDVFFWFGELSKIPRCSKNEERVSNFLLNFAKERNLEHYQDHENNIIIKKCATKGLENKKTIILQGHMDMVCEKRKGSSHDFLKDPLSLVENDGWLSAKDTTLGGDDGIAVAYILALLDGDYSHPNIEALITTQEELGMEGAQAVTSEHLSGQYLFNIDGEVEGEIFVGCAGGLNIYSNHKLVKTSSKLDKTYKIFVEHLTGGHSGQEIHKSRANALKIISRLLVNLSNEFEMLHFYGGSKHNAIPTHAEAVIRTDDNGLTELKKRREVLIKEREISDCSMEISCQKIDNQEQEVWTQETTQEILDGILCAPDGILYMHSQYYDIVEASISNGVLEEKEDSVQLVSLLRSSKKSLEVEQRYRYGKIMEKFGFEVFDNGGYPCWEYDPQSKLTPQVISVFKKMYQQEPQVKIIHCGLECGILKQELKEVDMITFGPDMQDVHTINERLNIESVGRTWEFLKELLVSLD